MVGRALIKVIAKDTNNISYTVGYGWESTRGQNMGVTLTQLVKASLSG